MEDLQAAIQGVLSDPAQMAQLQAMAQALGMQGGLYGEMAAKGWYPAEQAQPAQLQQVKTKYVQGCC